ncbi:heme-binding protein [Actinomadura kijaniata]|uniref:heme-binding protein n=1 Tax=Actinomadura kijaniata TaxID=46161 RepID=UPI00082AFC39|nr:heme-binding protein [Actinomadura kijaniata]
MLPRFTAGAAAVLCAVTVGPVLTAGNAAAHTRQAARTARAPYDRVLSNASLARATTAFVRAAARQRQRVTMVIMERSGTVRLVVRTRQAGPQTYESAKRKAYTAVAFGQPTSRLVGNVTIRQLPGTLTLPGGVPVKRRGFPIAGIGVGGAPDGRIDEAIARTVRAALRG